MAFTKVAKPVTSYTKQKLPVSPKVARYAIARFGQARYGNTEEFTKVAKPSTSYTKQQLPPG